MRRCCKYLHESIKKSCYARIDCLYVNGKKIGWNKDKTEYWTDEYAERYYQSGCMTKIFFWAERINFLLVDGMAYEAKVEFLGKRTYDESPTFDDCKVIRSLLVNGIIYSDHYIFHKDRLSFVVSYVGHNVKIFSPKSGIILEINDCMRTCEFKNYVNDKNLKIENHMTIETVLTRIIKENFQEYL